MRQFLEIKAQYPDAILMFRMGDFYEMFFEDAITVAPVLDIAVTSRDKNAEDPVPMAGVPYHAIGGYLRTLIERGFKVAICEQMETPEQAKARRGSKIVHRQVVRVVTPGVLVDEEHLRSEEPNYLVAVVAEQGPSGALGIAALDVSLGEFLVMRAADADGLRADLSRLGPREIVADPSLLGWLAEALGPDHPRLEGLAAASIAGAVLARVRRLAEESGGEGLPPTLERAAGLALCYAEATQPGQTLLLHRLRREAPQDHLILDEASLRNLEIFKTMRDGQRRGSLLWAVDATRTAMGARLLRGWIGAPLRDVGAIRGRQEGIAALLAEPRLRAEVQSRLRDVRDVIRLAARARLGTINPREMAALRGSLAALPGLAKLLSELAGRRIEDALPSALGLGEDLLWDLHAALAKGLVDEPPSHTRDGGVIRDGADAELDRQRGLRDGGREALAAIEARERERTGIANLKVQHNRVFGYYLEVPRAQIGRVPADYVRKQTIANAERYVTAELAEHESAVLGAMATALEREQALFAALRELVSAAGERLCQLGDRLATLDVLAGLAEIAEARGYVRPDLADEPVLEIEEGRHPVVEQMMDSGRFVPNSISLRAGVSAATARFALITGPNMGGKSTVMRQVALITILAQMGSFVPAVRARIGLCDRVFTRVGAADDLGRGESTFMVEMRETAAILSHASARSLVLLDEIGRGTATFDGLALAWSITEFIHDQIGCRAMFATHYHELCGLAERLAGLANLHVAVHEQRGDIVFLHRIEAGAAERSYGIQVGRLAGLPAPVLRRAQRILARLEANDQAGKGSQLALFSPSAPGEEVEEVAQAAPAAALDPGIGRLLSELRRVEPDDLSPREAHALLHALRDRALAAGC
jgi:DNA mismatch repair protein MutS